MLVWYVLAADIFFSEIVTNTLLTVATILRVEPIGHYQYALV